MDHDETDKLRDTEEVDIGERVIAEEARTGKPVFSYRRNAPEKLVERPLSNEEREAAKKSVLDCKYQETVPKGC